jgi:hypothetical protein
MSRLDDSSEAPLAGFDPQTDARSRQSQPQCARCHKFAKLLPGETDCAGCSGLLALEFPTITHASGAAVRGGW